MTKTHPFGRALLLTATMFAAATVLAEPLQGNAKSHRNHLLGENETRGAIDLADAKNVLADIGLSTQLLASDPVFDDRFGYSVAVDGNTAVVGAYLKDSGVLAEAGAVYVYLRSGNGWAQQAKLVPDDPLADATFGRSVAISSDRVIVGASAADNGAHLAAGAAYIFKRSGTNWSQEAKLMGSLTTANDRMGWSVAIDGDTAAVGAPSDDVGAVSNAGAVYVFTRSGVAWSQQGRLVASDPQDSDELGTSVDLSGNTVVSGAEGVDTVAESNVDSGAVYVFGRSANIWTQSSRLRSPVPAQGNYFGRSVSIDGGTISVGEPLKNGGAGAVQVFFGSGVSWPHQSELLPTDAASSDLFGHSVSVVGDHVLVGAYSEELNSGPMNRGAAYMFKRTGVAWAQLDKYFASDASSEDRFGFGVALTSSAGVIGAPFDEVLFEANYVKGGSAYVFNRGSPTTTTLVANPTTLSFGQQISLTAQVVGGTPTGNVEFRNGASVLAVAAVNGSGIASTNLSLAVGNYQIAAYYLGDANHVPSDSAATAVTVNAAATTTALSLSAGTNPSVYGQSVSFRAAVAVTPPGVGPANGNVEFRDGGALVATRALIAGEATFTTNTLAHNTGTAHPITATYVGNSNYATSTIGPLNHVVNRAAPTNTLTSSLNPSLSGQQINITATIAGGIPSCTVDFFADDLGDGAARFPIGFIGVSGNTATIAWTPPAVGQYAITADCGSDANQFSANGSGLTQVVNLAADIAVTKTNGVHSLEDGAPTTYTITVTNNGPEDITGLRVVDDVNTVTFDDSVNETSWTCSVVGTGDCSSSAATGDLALAGTPLLLDLINGDVATITLTTRVRAGQEGPVANTASVVIPVGWGDAVPANNSATDNDISGLFADGFE